jgi:hypothetical protein
VLKKGAAPQVRGESNGRAEEIVETAGLPRFLGGAVQAKLAVGTSDDPFEREADVVADAVMYGELAEETGIKAPLVERSDSARQGNDHASANPVRDRGAPLAAPVRQRVEGSVGLDLSDVRVHTGAGSGALPRDLNARALTHDRDIWLGARESPDDLGLLAHELAHVVQQSRSPSSAAEAAPPIQRQVDARAPAATDSPAASQSFGFSEDEMESRLASTPAGRADTSAAPPRVQAQTQSALVDLERGGGKGEGAGDREGGPGPEEQAERPRARVSPEDRSRALAGLLGRAGATPAEVAAPAQGTEFEGLVGEQVTAYLEGNLSDEQLVALDPITQQLLEGAAALGQHQVVEPETSALGEPTGASQLGRALSGLPRGYEREETWVQVIARVRDITSSLGGIVGIIGLVATVSGLILSLLVPPVGAFLLTVGRFCDIAALVLDAISLVLGGILTGYQLYRLKNATDPEEKRRLLGLVRQEALNTVMSGIAVATAVAPGAGRALAATRPAQAVGRGVRSLATGAGRRVGALGAAVGRSGLGQAVARSFVARGAAALGRGAAATGRGIAGVGRGIAGAGRRALDRGREFMIRLRATGPIRWTNRVTAQLEDRARNYFRMLAARNTRVGRFYNRRLRGFHERNLMVARSINDPIERAYQERLGRQLRDRLDDLQRQGITDPNVLNAQLRGEFGEQFGHARVGTTGAGNVQFVRSDSDVLLRVRQEEFTELQLLRDTHPHATPAQLAEHVNRSPFIRGRWNEEELRAFLGMHPGVRGAGGELAGGAVPKTAHHTIPAQMAPQIHRDPRFMQIVNDDRFYQNFIILAYPGLRRMPDAGAVSVPGARPGRPRRARNLVEATEGMFDRGDFTVPNRQFFSSPQFVDELRAQGSSGVWINPRNPAERWFFNPHLVIGHGWNWRQEVARQIFDLNSRLGLRGEPIRQLLMPAVREAARATRNVAAGPEAARGEAAPASLALVDRVLSQSRRNGPTRPSAATAPASPAAGMPAAGAALPLFLTGDAAQRPSAGSSAPFLNLIQSAMVHPAIRFGGAAAPESPPGPAPVSHTAAAAVPQAALAGEPETPPVPVLQSPGSIRHLRESRIEIVNAMNTVRAFIEATRESADGNREAGAAAHALESRNTEQQQTVETERADVTDQTGKLDQAEGAQQEMVSENQRGSSESQRAQSEGESVRAEGEDVSVEPRPEEPEKKSWLERAWDATAGAVWRNLVAPAVRAVRRKVNQVMQSINEFIMSMINQALGLDEIEAGLNAGGEDISGRRDSLAESDTGLQEQGEQAAAEKEGNQQTAQQAEANARQAMLLNEQGQTLYAGLAAHHDALAQEESAGIVYVLGFAERYAAYFAWQEHLVETAASGAALAAGSEAEPAFGAEPTLTYAHVTSVLAYIDDLEQGEASALGQVAGMSAASADAVPPELAAEESGSSGEALGRFAAGSAPRSAASRALRGATLDCVGRPPEEGFARLQAISDELLSLADNTESSRQAALSAVAEPHVAASASAGG